MYGQRKDISNDAVDGARPLSVGMSFHAWTRCRGVRMR